MGSKLEKADLLAGLADNTSGAVAPVNVRDVVESMDYSRGSYHWTTYTGTPIPLQGTGGPGGTNYVIIQGGTTGGSMVRFSHTSPNRLTYLGPVPINVRAQAAISISHDSGGILGFQWFKTGAAILPSYQTLVAAGGSFLPIPMLMADTLLPGDYLELGVNCQNLAGTNLTVLGGFVLVEEELIA